MKTVFRITAAVGLTLAPVAALAQAAAAVTTTDLNLRQGPGSGYAVITTMPGGTEVVIDGCVEGTKWCRVQYSDTEGFAFSDYLAASVGGAEVAVSERPGAFGVVDFEDTTTQGVIGGAVIGALTGGPVGAAVGAGVGAVATAVEPTRDVIEFIGNNTVDPILLDGEVVVGAGVPENVRLQPVPDYEYHYANVNGQTVLVDPETRQIVHVVR